MAIDLDFVGYRGAALHPYPATMPYPLAERLLLEHSHLGDLVFDPFAGSGTTLRAASAHGRPSVGADLNPLACLIARCSAAALTTLSFRGIEQLKQQVWEQLADRPEPLLPAGQSMERLNRWFDERTIEQLGQLARAVALIDDCRERDVLLLAFSRTSRKCSMARPGELKLWRRPDGFSPPDAYSVFFHEVLDLIAIMQSWRSAAGDGHLSDARVVHGDAREVASTLSSVDLVLTSPPYGDAWTTVAYGNFTMLSRMWLGAVDPLFSVSDPAMEDELLPGGRLRMGGGIGDLTTTVDASSLLASAFDAVQKESPERAQTMLSFFSDIRDVYRNVASALGPGGVLVNVVGPRRVAGVLVDTGAIISDFLATFGLEHDARLTRRVTGKRLPARTKHGTDRVAETINSETIDVLRRQ